MKHEPLRLTVTAAPAQLPVTLDEIKAQLRLDDDIVLDDALVMGFARSAVDEAEQFTGRSLITRTYTLFLDGWPAPAGCDWREGAREASSRGPLMSSTVELPRPPLLSVVHVKTYDDSDLATTYSPSNYFVDTRTHPGRLVPRTSAAAPAPTRPANGIEIQFTAGYGEDMADVPQGIRDGILNLTAFLYENRGDMPAGTAMQAAGAGALLQPFRLLRI